MPSLWMAATLTMWLPHGSEVVRVDSIFFKRNTATMAVLLLRIACRKIDASYENDTVCTCIYPDDHHTNESIYIGGEL